MKSSEGKKKIARRSRSKLRVSMKESDNTSSLRINSTRIMSGLSATSSAKRMSSKRRNEICKESSKKSKKRI